MANNKLVRIKNRVVDMITKSEGYEIDPETYIPAKGEIIAINSTYGGIGNDITYIGDGKTVLNKCNMISHKKYIIIHNIGDEARQNYVGEIILSTDYWCINSEHPILLTVESPGFATKRVIIKDTNTSGRIPLIELTDANIDRNETDSDIYIDYELMFSGPLYDLKVIYPDTITFIGMRDGDETITEEPFKYEIVITAELL